MSTEPMERRPVMPAVVPPWASFFILREAEERLENISAALLASPVPERAMRGRELAQGLMFLRESVRQLQERMGAPAPTVVVVPVGEVLSTQEAAALLGVTARRVGHLIAEGKLEATRLGPGRPWRVDAMSVRALVAVRREVA